MKGEWKFRLAEPSDAPAFAEWTASNPLIDKRDIEATLKSNNPTCIFVVAEKNGVPVMLAPLYAQMVLAHLTPNPDASGKDRIRALQGLLDFATVFAVQYGVRELTTLTRAEYPLAKVAEHLGFEKDERNVYRLDINRRIAAETEKVQ